MKWFDVDHYLNLMGFRRRVLWHLGEIEGKLDVLIAQGGNIMALIDELMVDVQDEDTVIGSVEQLLTNLTALLGSAAGDPAKIAQIKNLVDAQKARLAQAVAANTPAATTP